MTLGESIVTVIFMEYEKFVKCRVYSNNHKKKNKRR